jgi:hypothetical protein
MHMRGPPPAPGQALRRCSWPGWPAGPAGRPCGTGTQPAAWLRAGAVGVSLAGAGRVTGAPEDSGVSAAGTAIAGVLRAWVGAGRRAARAGRNLYYAGPRPLRACPHRREPVRGDRGQRRGETLLQSKRAPHTAKAPPCERRQTPGSRAQHPSTSILIPTHYSPSPGLLQRLLVHHLRLPFELGLRAGRGAKGL